ncbi:MAG: AAA family ATPase, partial [Candidatus Woesearchaeota archaeon]|nr:AAA family ATPase [Candidatus Woesearchaeota archaeon]
MGLFEGMLKNNESLFMDPVVLDYDYLPKLLPFREKEQMHVANCIKPLFQGRNGKSLLIHGAPGIGKTAAIKHILRELEEQSDEIIP